LIEIALLIASQVMTGVCIVAVLKNDVKWIKEWTRAHDESDTQRFASLREADQRHEELNREERQDIRGSVEGVSRRVAVLEGRAEALR